MSKAVRQLTTHKLPRAGLLRDPESSTAALPLWRKILAIQEATQLRTLQINTSLQ
jgi:hypothetical protein